MQKKYNIKRICASTAAAPRFSPSPKMFGFIPDFYGYSSTLNFAFIGEAKTKDDLANDHTKDQIRAYLSYLDPFKESAIFFRVEKEDFFRFKRFLKYSFKAKKGTFKVNAESI
jgi:hypothetical protein